MRQVDGEKVSASYPGRSAYLPNVLVLSRDGMKGEQKSAEGVIAIAHDGEGPSVISGLRTEPRWTRQTQTRGLGCLRTPGR
jgi:hypothetical protein